MNRRRFLAASALALLPLPAKAQQAIAAMRFSALQPGAALPPEYVSLAFSTKKRRTDYALVAEEGRTALRARAGSILPNAHTSRVRMLVVESGATRLGRWVGYERDVAADYRRAFGAEPPAINGVAVSTDTDNTGETAESFYGDVIFRPRRPS